MSSPASCRKQILAILGKNPYREILDENWDVKYLYGGSYNYGVYKKRLYRNGNKLCKRKGNKDVLDSESAENDFLYNHLTLNEYMDLFTGEPVK